MSPSAILRYIVLLCLPVTLLAESHTSLVRAVVPDQQTMLALQKAGVDLMETRGKVGGTLEFPMAADKIARLRDAGISFTVVQENMEEAYAAAVQGLGPVNAFGFGVGSMGGHYTYWEVAKQLDTMKLLYPNLITARQIIGTTTKGRAIWAVEISDNPDVQEDEPEALYTGLIHAREPAGMMSVVYFMWHLLTNYGTDPQATFLVDNRQLWFVPVVNADGYEYNRKFYPSGGGMHRKNCRNVDTTTSGSYYGTDLNRNFGTHEFWNSPYGGSSTTPTDDDYRGTLEWSEPETAALRDLAYAHSFRAALNYHTYGDYLIYPWGWKPFETPDSLQFREYSSDMTAFNHYFAGRAIQTVGYSVRGTSDDFLYGDTAKPKAFAWTPECGTQFWALPGDILPIAQENLGQNLYLAYIAGSYVLPTTHAINDTNGNGYLERGEAFDLTVTLRNKGVADAAGVTARLVSGTPWIMVPADPIDLGAVPSWSSMPAVFHASVVPNAPMGVPAALYVQVSDQSGASITDTISVMLGRPAIAFVDSARVLTNWTVQSPWGLSTTNHTAPTSFTDSPTGSYVANIDKSITLTNGLSLAGAQSATLTFWTRWDLESGYDFARVEVSTNNGSSWRSLPGIYTHLGSGDGTQTATDYGLDGTQTTWVQEEMNLSGYTNQTIKLRFRITSDVSVQGDGWYVDDIRLFAYVPNYDTALAITPGEVTLSGLVGVRTDLPVTIHNYTGATVALAVAESSLASVAFGAPAVRPAPPITLEPFIQKLRTAQLPAPVTSEAAHGPEAYATAITDLRGDNLGDGVDLHDVFVQKRTTIIGDVLDVRLTLTSPDSNLAGFISLDTDQDFGTGTWPVPWGLGVRSRDLASEFEMLVDLSGTIAESLGLGQLPVAALFRTVDTSFVFLPFIPDITVDSVMTITVTGIPFGALGINDPDQNLNLAVSFSRLALTAPFPDFAPNTGHGIVGTETGVSWIRESAHNLTIAAGDSAVIDVSVLGALATGLHRAQIRFTDGAHAPLVLPIQVTVTGPGGAVLTMSAASLTDTLSPGDSTTFEVTLGNTGTNDLFWGILDSAGASWLRADPPAGMIPPSGSEPVTLALHASGLVPGSTHSVQLLILSNDPSHATVQFPVTLYVDDGTDVGPGPGLPAAYRLYQNYPNPFNPSTNVRMDVQSDSDVSVVVYDLLGREVAVIARGRFAPGVHILSWHAENAASGVYICRMTAGSTVQTMKLLLVR